MRGIPLSFCLLFLIACSSGPAPTAPTASATPEPASTDSSDTAGEQWWKAAKPCAEGTTLKGGEPPAGNAVWCEKADGTKHGPLTAFRSDGTKERCLVYRNGKEEGRFTLYHPNGKMADQGRYHEGKFEGRRTTW